MTTTPLLTVITATYQADRTLGALARSLEQQDLADFEWIVQDGGSNDSTRAIAESAAVPAVRFVSEPDDGIYDAFNRALSAARGEYILFLGADDRLVAPDALSRAADLIARQTDPPDALLCSVVDERGTRFDSRLSATTLVLNTVHHQGVFYRRSLFDRFRYDVASRVVADYELNLLLRVEKRPTVTADLVVAECASDGVSHTANEWRLYHDLHDLRRRHMSSVLSAGLLVVGIANVARRRLLGRRS